MTYIIVAVSQNGVIGNSGKLPWRLPTDLANFKRLTIGQTVIMGRKTYQSIGKPLPGRSNIIISRNPNFKITGCIVSPNLQQAVEQAGSGKVFIIGGETVFKEAITLTNKIYLTRVLADLKGDRFFLFDERGWKKTFSLSYPAKDGNQYAFELQEWIRL